MHRFVASLSLIMLALPVPLGLCMEPRQDPQTGKIRLLNMGADAVPGTASPLVILFVDPLITAQTVPLYESIFEPRTTERFMRIYMPRTEERMRSDYDLIMISDATVDNFPARYFPWMVRSIREEGLGFLTTGGSAMYGGHESQTSWDGTTIVEVFAVTFSPYEIYDSGSSGNKPPFKIVPAESGDPFVTSLPWESCPRVNYKIHIVQTRQGAKTLLEMDIPQAHPVLSTWDVANGRSTNLIFDWYPWRLEPFQEWAYYVDFASNLIYYSAGLEVPQDLELVHSVRQGLSDYFETRTILISLLAFVEKFGANTNVVERELGELDSQFGLAQEEYRDQEWVRARETLDDLDARIDELDEEAIRLKDRALMWVYIIEWFSVTATMFIAGFVLWTLMVRRRLYGEVGVTRMV